MNQRKISALSSSDNNKLNYFDTEDNLLENPLCLCEYYNKNNQRSHLLMCCCNCEAMDTLCTSLVCCCCRDENDFDDLDEQISTNLSYSAKTKRFLYNRYKLMAEVMSEINDRIRIPSIGGAKKMNLDYFITLASLGIYVFIGTFSFIFSLLALFILPLIIYTRFFLIRQKATQKSIKTAFYFILNSFILAIVLFNIKLVHEMNNVMSQNEIYFLNFLLLKSVLFLIYLKNSDPGCLESNGKNLISQNDQSNYCKYCNIKKDSLMDQIGHCPQCSKCIYKRDHHCFWIDNCVGYLNHKKFLYFLIYLLVFFVYSFLLIKRKLQSLECSLKVFWYDQLSPIENSNSFSCLFDVYYTNSSRALLTLLFIQLIPLISYLILIIAQQILFISLGLTQYQLFRLSQKNVRFSLALYLSSNLKLSNSLNNLFKFLFIYRKKSDLSQEFNENFIHNHFV